MAPEILVNVSYCAAHVKGYGPPIPGHVHARWLLECVRHLKKTTGWPVIVSMTGWPGMLRCETSRTNPERDIMWQVWQEARLLGVADCPAHQGGAGTCLRMGLEAAHKIEVPYLLHTAEDVVLAPGTAMRWYSALVDGYDYVGSPWGHHEEFINAQCFACRVNTLAGNFDPGSLTGERHIERYLQEMMQGRRLCLEKSVNYYHTHDFTEYLDILTRVRCDNQLSISVMHDRKNPFG